MRKNLYGRILKEEPMEQHINTVAKSCPRILLKLKTN